MPLSIAFSALIGYRKYLDLIWHWGEFAHRLPPLYLFVMGSRKILLWGFVSTVAASLVAELLTPSLPIFATGWDWLVSGVRSVWAWAWDTSAVTNVLLYGALVILLIMSIGFIRSQYRRYRQLSFLSYTEDTFDNVVWRWKYLNRRINEPVPFCVVCDMQLIYTNEESKNLQNVVGAIDTLLHCENCGESRLLTFLGSHTELQESIVRKIDRKIRIGEWHDVVAAQ